MSRYTSTTIRTGPATNEEKYEACQLVQKMSDMVCVKPSSKRVVRRTIYEFKGRSISSWKCSEFLYKKDPCPLPTPARGLFTIDNEGGGKVTSSEIIARGYNKFFNVGETKTTNWPWIEENTKGPYELTVKENGCLILASAMDEGRSLLVTSKHAIGVPHSDVGNKWVHLHLSRAGRTPEEFAAFLHEHNATAVFELCDDSFEEHILEYPEKMRGLYLHGVNRNSVDLDTWPSSEVTKVAEEFGFMITKYFSFDALEEGRALADKVRNSHVLDGRAIEGFVVRCKLVGSEAPFMFKIKYDEPYLMFREWREVTNRILSDKPFKTTYGLTKQYVAWVKQQVRENPGDFEDFKKQRGIIATRKRFLEYFKTQGGTDEAVFGHMAAGGEMKVLLVPVATIGCGKTTVSLILSKLFGFGHIQNDDITTKKNPRGAFHRAILKEFDDHSFVIADRNNHIPMLRQTLTTTIRDELPNCRIVALYWSHEDATHEELLEKTSGRVVGRGEAHQSLTPQSTPHFRRVMRQFVHSFHPIDLESAADHLIEDVIELDPMADSAANARTVINELCNLFPDQLARPADTEIDQALQEALVFKPSVRKVVKDSTARDLKQHKEGKPVFVCLTPRNINISEWLKGLMATPSSVDWSVCKKLLQSGEHSRPSHITLAHIASTKTPSEKSLYNGYVDVLGKQSVVDRTVVTCAADYIVCNGDAMALRVKNMAIDDDAGFPDVVVDRSKDRQPAGKGISKTSLRSANEVPHITLQVGKGIKAVQANDMLKVVFGQDNAESPLNCPCGWAVIPVTLSFEAVLDKSMS
ncbi:trna ligase [Dipsacomyces acuminosporus]|nr:trna ligase [Dipsacomyces acuminosporus]